MRLPLLLLVPVAGLCAGLSAADAGSPSLPAASAAVDSAIARPELAAYRG